MDGAKAKRFAQQLGWNKTIYFNYFKECLMDRIERKLSRTIGSLPGKILGLVKRGRRQAIL